MALAAVVVLGLLGIVLTRSGGEASAGAPRPPSSDYPSGDHWHAAFAVNICGEWLPDPPEFHTAAGRSNVQAGIHSHGDGFIHIHPFTSAEAGDHATLGKFFDYGGWKASTDEIEVWQGPSFDPDKTTWRTGDRCPGADGRLGTGDRGRVVFEVNCTRVSGNPSDHKLADQEVVAIGFLPKGEAMGAPPNAASAPESDDGRPTRAIDQARCRPSAESNPGGPAPTSTTGAAPTATSLSSTPVTTSVASTSTTGQ